MRGEYIFLDGISRFFWGATIVVALLSLLFKLPLRIMLFKCTMWERPRGDVMLIGVGGVEGVEGFDGKGKHLFNSWTTE